MATITLANKKREQKIIEPVFVKKSVTIKTAILVGFSYNNIANRSDRKRIELIGPIIDLYKAYKMVKKIGCDRIIVTTDISENIKSSPVQNAIVRHVVDNDILEFISMLKNNNQHHQYQNLKNLTETWENILEDSTHVFLYYTGHALDGKILLPKIETIVSPISSKGESIGFITIRNMIIYKAVEDADMFIILDCCNGSNLNLPFKLQYSLLDEDVNLEDNDGNLEDNNVELEKNTFDKDNLSLYQLAENILVGPREFFTSEIVCISASESHQKSMSSRYGSLFSLHFFDLIENETDLPKLIHKLNEECDKKNNSNQTVMVHTSYPDIYDIWSWLRSETSMDVKFLNNYLEVRKPTATIEVQVEQ